MRNRKARAIRSMEDRVMTPRCPWCGYWLVARVGKTGAYFYCRCSSRPKLAKAKQRPNRVIRVAVRTAA